MKRPINRNDVARLAGVAPSTVSNVINGTKFVSDEIKQRVQKAIEELDYQPNLLARSFKMNSTRQISVLVRSPSVTSASLSSAVISSTAAEIPLPPLVQKGAMVFPAKSVSSKNVFKIFGIVPHQMGKPT